MQELESVLSMQKAEWKVCFYDFHIVCAGKEKGWGLSDLQLDHVN